MRYGLLILQVLTDSELVLLSNFSKIAGSWSATPGLMRQIPLAESGHLSGLSIGIESQFDFVLVSADIPFYDVEVVKDIAFSSDHWPVFVSCAPSKRWNLRQKAKLCTSRVPRPVVSH